MFGRTAPDGALARSVPSPGCVYASGLGCSELLDPVTVSQLHPTWAPLSFVLIQCYETSSFFILISSTLVLHKPFLNVWSVRLVWTSIVLAPSVDLGHVSPAREPFYCPRAQGSRSEVISTGHTTHVNEISQ